MTRINRFGQPIGAAVAGWTPRPLPPHTPLHGRFCSVEKFIAARHARDFTAAFLNEPDDRLWTYLLEERPETAEGFAQLCDHLEASGDPMHQAIVAHETGRVVGSAAFMRIDRGNGAIEVGSIRFSPAVQRRPAGTEAMYLMMRRAFDELGYRRYEWKCDALNEPSRRAADRYGFSFEGIFRQAVVIKGRSRDTAWYSVIDRDWPVLRAGFERWLAPDNFNADGTQKHGLAALRTAASSDGS